MKEKELRDIEIDLLLEGIHRRYGHDFRHYARASLNRRISSFLVRKNLEQISELIPRILRDVDMFNCPNQDLS